MGRERSPSYTSNHTKRNTQNATYKMQHTQHKNTQFAEKGRARVRVRATEKRNRARGFGNGKGKCASRG